MTVYKLRDRSGAPIHDSALAFAMGAVSGVSTINKFGESPDVTAGTTEELWDGAAAYSWPATALMTSISQTADQAAMRGATINVQGLDANWALVSQDVVLDATLTTNVVTLDTPLIRCFRMKVMANVVSTSPIRVHNAAETQDYAIIQTGNNQTLMALYTVPASCTVFLTNYYAAHHPTSGQQPTSNGLKLWARDNANGYAPQLKHSVGVAQDGGFQHSFNPYYTFSEKTDIFLTASPAGSAVYVSGGFDLILIDNEILT